MTHRTLDEHLKQTKHATTKQQTTKPKYKIKGFYKETEFQETPIGKMPKQWKIITLGDYVEIEVGKRPKGGALQKGDAISLGGEHISENGYLNMNNLKYIPFDFYRSLNKGKVYQDDVLLVKDGYVGKVAYVDKLPYPYVAVNEHVFIIRSKNKNILINKFIFYVLFSYIGQTQIKRLAHGMINGIKQQDLLSIKIPLPPLEEQHGIVEVLSALDKTIKETEKIIKKLKRLKHGLMQELLTKGIGHKEFKETPIGKIPKEWEVVPLSRIAKIIMGQSPPSSTYNEEGVGLPFLQGKAEFGRIYPTPKMYTSKPTKIAEKGYLLISVRAPVGDVNIAPYRLCIGRGLAAIRFASNVTSTLFYFYYFSFIKPRLESMGKGSTFKAVTKRDLESLLVPKPPIEEQKIIADTLYSIDRWIEAEEKRREKFERLKRGLMELLLTGRVRVRVERVSEVGESPGSAGVGGR